MNNKEKPYFYLNWQCIKCGAEYGTQPEYCHACGCNKSKRIEPKKSFL